MVTAQETTQPLVSIVIACFNHARFLREAIESALTQTYRPIEVIVVDDGSTDESAEVARQYPVRLLQQANAGLAAAGNAGMRAATGTFVMRLDADDRLAPTYVEETARVLMADPSIHFVYTPVRYFGARTGSYAIEPFNPKSLAERNYIHASALMCRGSFEAVGGYNTDMRGLRCEDWDLWLGFAERGLRGMLLDKPLLEYRQHAGPSMVTINVLTLAGLRREIAIISRLQDHHPAAFAPARLVHRLLRLPSRLSRHEVGPRFALMLLGFYAALLVRRMYLDLVCRNHTPVAALDRT